MILALTLACWQPAPFTPPPPAQVEASDVLEGTAGSIKPPAEGGAAAAEPEAAAPEAAAAAEPEAATPEGEAPAEPDAAPAADDAADDAPPPSTDKPVKPYVAHTTGRPITLVGDDGVPVQVIATENTEVTVLMEGVDRVKVRCTGCTPVVEGWLQTRVIVK